MMRTISITMTLGLALLAGCRATIPEGRFACTADADCPPGQSCMASVCRSAPASDGGVPDGATCGACDDDIFCNGSETCEGATCMPGEAPCSAAECDEVLDECEGLTRVRIVHGSFRIGDARVFVGGDEIATVGYGQVVEAYLATPPGEVDVTVEPLVGAPFDVSVDLGGPTILVIGPETADVGDTVYAIADELPAPGPDPMFRIVSVMATRDRVQVGNWLSSAPTIEEVGLGEPTQEHVAQGGVANAAVIDWSGKDIGDQLAGFTTGLEESAWIVLFGDLRVHPGAPNGPAAVVVDGAGTPIPRDTVLQVLNATSDDLPVHLCPVQAGEPAGPGTPLAARTLWGAFVYPSGFLDYGFRIGPSEAVACSNAALPTIELSAPSPGARALAVISGTAAAPTLTWLVEPEYAAIDDGLTQLSLTHLSPSTLPSVALQLRDEELGDVLLSAGDGVAIFGPVPPPIAAGSLAIWNPSVGALATATFTEDEVRGSLHFVYTEAATTAVPRARVVHAPYDVTWTASVVVP